MGFEGTVCPIYIFVLLSPDTIPVFRGGGMTTGGGVIMAGCCLALQDCFVSPVPQTGTRPIHLAEALDAMAHTIKTNIILEIILI